MRQSAARDGPYRPTTLLVSQELKSIACRKTRPQAAAGTFALKVMWPFASAATTARSVRPAPESPRTVPPVAGSMV